VSRRPASRITLAFAGLWGRHEVAKRFAEHRILIHPRLDPIEVDCQALFTGDQSQALVVISAPPSTRDYEKLRSLAANEDRLSKLVINRSIIDVVLC
jgi:hypothetical protein